MTFPVREGFVFAESQPWEEAGPGVRRQILGFDAELMMVRVLFQKDAVGYIHQHPHRQVTFIEGGKFMVTIGNEKKLQSVGDCYFVPPDVPHGVVALEEGALIDVFTPARKDFVKEQA
jgi:quercetin dioxygenase-like cupin family protein